MAFNETLALGIKRRPSFNLEKALGAISSPDIFLGDNLDFAISKTTPQFMPESALGTVDILRKVFVEKRPIRPPFGREVETQEIAGGLFTQVPLEIGSRLLELPAQIGKNIIEIASTLFPSVLQRTPTPREKERIPSRLRETGDIYETAIAGGWSDREAASIATVYGVSSMVADFAIGTDILAHTTLRAMGLTPQLRSAMRNLGVAPDETLDGYMRNASRLFSEAARTGNKEKAVQTLRDAMTIDIALQGSGVSRLNVLGRQLFRASEKALEPLLGREAVRIPRLAREQLPGFRARPGQTQPFGLSLEEIEPVGFGTLKKGDKVVARPKMAGGKEREFSVITTSALGITGEGGGNFKLPILFKKEDFSFFRETETALRIAPELEPLDQEILISLQEFERLPFEKQELVFEQIPKEMQQRIIGYTEEYGQNPLKQLASDIARGKVKVRAPKTIKTEALQELGHGNYARIFRSDTNLQSLDELAETVGVSDDELLREIGTAIARRKSDLQSAQVHKFEARQTAKEQKTADRAAEKAAKLERKQQEIRERTFENIENISRGDTEGIISRLESRFLSLEDIESIVLEDGTRLVDASKVKRNNDGSLAAVITKKEIELLKTNYTEELPKEKWTERSMLVEGKEVIFNAARSMELPYKWFERKGLGTLYDPILQAGRDGETMKQLFLQRFKNVELYKTHGWFTPNRFLLSSSEASNIGKYYLTRQEKGYDVSFEKLSAKEKTFVEIFDGIIQETEQRFFEVAKKNGKTPNRVIDYAPIMTRGDIKLADEIGAQDWLFRKHPSFFSTKERVEKVPVSLYETDYREVASHWLDGITQFLTLGDTTPKIKYLIDSNEFKEILKGEDWQFVKNWLQDITTPKQPVTVGGQALTAISRIGRKVTAIAALGLNYASVLKQTLTQIPIMIISKTRPKLQSEYAKAFGISVSDLPSITKRKGDIAIQDLQGRLGRIFTGALTEFDRKNAQISLNGLLDKEAAKIVKAERLESFADLTPEMQKFVEKQAQDILDMWYGGFFKGQRPEAFRKELGNFILMFLYPLTSQLNGFFRHILRAQGNAKWKAGAEVLAAVIAIAYIEQVIENLSPQWSDEVGMTKDITQSLAGNIPIVSDVVYAFLNEREIQVSPVIGNINTLFRSLEKKNERTLWAFAETLGTPKQFRKIREGMQILEEGGITDNDGKMLVQVNDTIELVRSFLRGKYGSIAAQDWVRNIGVKTEDRKWFVPEVEFLQNGNYGRKAELYRSFNRPTRKQMYDFLSEAQQRRLDEETTSSRKRGSPLESSLKGLGLPQLTGLDDRILQYFNE